MGGKLTCGASKREITPPEGLLGGVYGLFGVVYAGVIDPLFLRAIALSDGANRALLVAFDLDKAPNPAEWIPEIARRTGIPEENILYAGTHTHSAPVTTFRPRERHAQQVTPYMLECKHAYEAFVHEKLMEAVDEAVSDMRPARFGFGRGESHINVNRSAEYQFEAEDGALYPFATQGPNGAAWVDRAVSVLKVDDLSGKPIAFFVNYAVHCCTMYLNRYNADGAMGVSGDIAGTVSRHIEDKYPGSVAAWTSGAAGDVNPVIANEVFYPDPKNGGKQVWLFPDSNTINALMLALSARHFADILRVIRGIDEYSEHMCIGAAVEWSETDLADPPAGETATAGKYRVRLHLLRLGDVALVGVGGEMFSSLGRLIREASPLTNTVIINHEASLLDDAGYVMDDATLERVRRPAPVKTGVPGGAARMKAGQLAPSLRAHTASLFRKVM